MGLEFGVIETYGNELNSTTSTSSIFRYYGTVCGQPDPSLSGCVPSGHVIDDTWNSKTSAMSDKPFTQGGIDYYSPGIVCPSGYETVGIASKLSGGNVSSSGAAFDPPAMPTVSGIAVDLYDPAPNVLLEAMFERETAILCCPRYVSERPVCAKFTYLRTYSHTGTVDILQTPTEGAVPRYRLIPYLQQSAPSS